MDIYLANGINDHMIEQEWDRVADNRFNMIIREEDSSLSEITEPYIMNSLIDEKAEKIIDCGCGVGHLSYLLSEKLHRDVIGIDLSGKSIDLAIKHYGITDKRKYIKTSIIDYAQNHINHFDACVANMVLMDLHDLDSNIQAIGNLLKNQGQFSFTIIHPCFWPIYWNYFNEPWFNYQDEIYIKAPFKINEVIVGQTTHIHRPLEKYILLCQKTGFQIIEIKELYSPDIKEKSIYKYPRFLGFVCKKSEG